MHNDILLPNDAISDDDDDALDELYKTAHGSVSHSTLYHRGKLRKSMSVGDINLPNLTEGIRYNVY